MATELLRAASAQQPVGGQPAARHEPASLTIRIVTIAFVRPFSGRGESSHSGIVYSSYRSGHMSRSCWYSPRYCPVGSEVADGSRPLSPSDADRARRASGHGAEPLHGAGDPSLREVLDRLSVEPVEQARGWELLGGRGRRPEDEAREEQGRR